MEMLLDRIFLGYDGKSSGLQAILEPLRPAIYEELDPVISQQGRVFLFFFGVETFHKIPWNIHISSNI